MTVATTSNKKTYSGLIAQNTFGYDFRVDVKADMEVYFSDVLQAPGDWTITNLTNPGGGNVVLNTPLVANTTIVLLRNVAQTQGVDYQPLDAFPADTHEAALDRLTFICQQLEEQYDRSLRASVSSNIDTALPAPVAETVLGWNATEDAIINQPVPTGGIVSDGSITAVKLAANAVTTAKILDGAVTNAKRTYPAQLTNHVRAGNTQIYNGEAVQTDFDADSSLVDAAWESVGPTGSGADNIWATLDQLPASARILILDIEGTLVSGSAVGVSTIIHVTSGNIAVPNVADRTRVFLMAADPDASGEVYGQSAQVMIPLHTDQTFKIYKDTAGAPSTENITLKYRGFMTD